MLLNNLKGLRCDSNKGARQESIAMKFIQSKLVSFGLGVLGFLLISASANSTTDAYQFTEHDASFLSAFSLLSLEEMPQDPSNHVADNEEAAKLGKKLFFDTRLSSTGNVACANCHQPEKYFTDGLKQSVAVGTTRRNSQTVLGMAYSPWFFWDGRKDSLWSQALGPMEDPAEHGINRMFAVRLLARHYANEYKALFNQDISSLRSLPNINDSFSSEAVQEEWNDLDDEERLAVNEAFANLGKAIMAYERRLTLEPARFDQFVEEIKNRNRPDQLAKLMSEEEVLGMRLFMGKANCSSCHNGPLFTNFEFHNIGAPEHDEKQVDLGRFHGVVSLQKDEFTCLSAYSDAKANECEEMRFLKKQGPELIGAFKTPTLRNVAKTAPYMQSGQFAALEDVINHYNKPTPPFYDREQHSTRPHFDIMPLKLTDEERAQLQAFLETLTSPIPENNIWWQAP